MLITSALIIFIIVIISLFLSYLFLPTSFLSHPEVNAAPSMTLYSLIIVTL